MTIGTTTKTKSPSLLRGLHLFCLLPLTLSLLFTTFAMPNNNFISTLQNITDMQTTFEKTLRRHTGVSPETSCFTVMGRIVVRRDRRYFSTSNFLRSCVHCRTTTQAEFWKESKKSLPITMLLCWLFTIRAHWMVAAKATNF